MKIPKYVDRWLEQRAQAAEKFLDADRKIADWLEKNNISVSGDDILCGACSLCEPYASIEAIRRCIKEETTT